MASFCIFVAMLHVTLIYDQADINGKKFRIVLDETYQIYKDYLEAFNRFLKDEKGEIFKVLLETPKLEEDLALELDREVNKLLMTPTALKCYNEKLKSQEKDLIKYEQLGEKKFAFMVLLEFAVLHYRYQTDMCDVIELESSDANYNSNLQKIKELLAVQLANKMAICTASFLTLFKRLNNDIKLIQLVFFDKLEIEVTSISMTNGDRHKDDASVMAVGFQTTKEEQVIKKKIIFKPMSLLMDFAINGETFKLCQLEDDYVKKLCALLDQPKKEEEDHAYIPFGRSFIERFNLFEKTEENKLKVYTVLPMEPEEVFREELPFSEPITLTEDEKKNIENYMKKIMNESYGYIEFLESPYIQKIDIFDVIAWYDNENPQKSIQAYFDDSFAESVKVHSFSQEDSDLYLYKAYNLNKIITLFDSGDIHDENIIIGENKDPYVIDWEATATYRLGYLFNCLNGLDPSFTDVIEKSKNQILFFGNKSKRYYTSDKISYFEFPKPMSVSKDAKIIEIDSSKSKNQIEMSNNFLEEIKKDSRKVTFSNWVNARINKKLIGRNVLNSTSQYSRNIKDIRSLKFQIYLNFQQGVFYLQKFLMTLPTNSRDEMGSLKDHPECFEKLKGKLPKIIEKLKGIYPDIRTSLQSLKDEIPKDSLELTVSLEKSI
jgi:hypothetical protein